MMMSLRDLEYFVATAELGSMAAAARQCRVSQATLSIQLRKLEEQLGAPLLEALGRGVQLTHAGRALLPGAQQLLRDAANFVDAAQRWRDPLAGPLRIGAFPTLAPYWFPALVQRVRKSLPQVTLELHEEKSAVLEERLAAGALDAIVLALPASRADWVVRPLFTEAFWAALSAQHPLAAKARITANMLQSERMLLLEDGHCLRGQALAYCARIGVTEDVTYRATSLETLRNMVRAGAGLTLLPACATTTKDAGLVYRPLHDAAAKRTIGLCWRPQSSRAAACQRLAEIMKP